MTEPTIWDTDHFPVLKAAVDALNKDRAFVGVNFSTLAEATGLEPVDVLAAARHLENAGLIELRVVMPAARGRVVKVSGQAQQLAGAWPSEENVADRLISALEAIADNTNDEDERTRVRKILDALSGSGREIAVSVGAALLTGVAQ